MGVGKKQEVKGSGSGCVQRSPPRWWREDAQAPGRRGCKRPDQRPRNGQRDIRVSKKKKLPGAQQAP